MCLEALAESQNELIMLNVTYKRWKLFSVLRHVVFSEMCFLVSHLQSEGLTFV